MTTEDKPNTLQEYKAKHLTPYADTLDDSNLTNQYDDKDITLPKQTLMLFGDNPDKIQFLKNIYTGDKEKPTFNEWLEDYQKFTLFLQNQTELQKIDKIKTDLEQLEQGYEERKAVLPEEEKKIWEKEIRRLDNIYTKWRSHWLEINKEISKQTQTTLQREAPKKIDMRVVKITPSDIANLFKQNPGEPPSQ